MTRPDAVLPEPPAPAGAGATDPARPGRAGVARALVRGALSEYAVFFIALLYFLAAWALEPDLARPENLADVLSNLLPLLALALGQTVVMITGGIDLSAAAAMGAASVVGAWVMSETRHLGLLAGHPWAVPAGVAAIVLTAALVGLFNGAAVTLLRMPPFIVTMTTMMAVGGLAVWGGQAIKGSAAARAAAEAAAAGRRSAPMSVDPNIGNLPEGFVEIAVGGWAGGAVPYALLIVGVLAVALHVTLAHTLLGRRLYAVGMNPAAALVSGARVRAVTASAYVIGGLCAGVAAVLYSARLETGKPELLGRDAMLDVIGAAVIGGTSLFGGRGKVLWTVFGVLLFTLIANTLNWLGLADEKVMVVKGCVILAAALLDLLRRRMLGPT